MTKTDRNVIDCTFELNQQRLRVEDHHRYFKGLITQDNFDAEQRSINDLLYEIQRTITSLQVFATDLQKSL